MAAATTATDDTAPGHPGEAQTWLPGDPSPQTPGARTGQVAALDALQVRVHPEEFAQPVIHHECHGADEARGEEDLALGAVQSRALDLGRSVLHVGEVQVPARGCEGR